MPQLTIRCPICGAGCSEHGRFIQCVVHGFFKVADLLTVTMEY